MSEDNLVCVICEKSSSLRCARCKRTAYCSKEHQKLDWKVHKKSCEPITSKCFKMVEDQRLGRHLISTRYIAKDEIVLEESPLVTGPMQLTPPVCLGCYKLLNQFNSRNCSRCNWPVCSSDCENSTAHKPECEITTKFKKEKVAITNFEVEHPSYQCITVLRCLYLSKSDKVPWEKISKLHSHSEERKKSERYNRDILMIAQFIPRFFNFHEFTQEEILNMTGILEINAHHVPIQQPGFIAIYDVASLIEHNCLANCSKTLCKDGKIIIKAAREIQKGEHISISYTNPLWGLQLRQNHLLETKYFVCECDRCSDPTELGTNFNSLKCTTSHCTGYFAPHKSSVPLEFFWICMECNRTYVEGENAEIFANIAKDFSNINRKDSKSCADFLMKHKKHLHQNHYLMVDVKLALIGCFVHEEVSGASDEYLQQIINICKNLIELGSKLAPAENRLRGIVYFHLYSALAELRQRKLLSGEMDDSQLKENLLTCRDILKKAYSFLKTEPEDLAEGQMAIAAERYLREINKFMEDSQLFE